MASGSCWAWLSKPDRHRNAAARRRGQLGAPRVVQAERIGEQRDRPRIRPGGGPALDVADRPHAQPGPLGEFLLGQPRRQPAAAQQPAETAEAIRFHPASLPQDTERVTVAE
jgi:hypothetical protein